MVRIATFVFFDIETTGLPHQEQNRTKITELSFIAVSRKDMRRHTGTLRTVSKLTFVLNPHRPIHPKASAITGLTNETLKYAPSFREKINTINYFLEDLDKPVCLVAHNGDKFDYKILLAECADANASLPMDLLCVDSLPGFRKLLKSKMNDELLTDDEDDWPNLNITPEEFLEIDEIINNNDSKKKVKVKRNEKISQGSFQLPDIYRKLLQKEPDNAHRAEDDCWFLLQCVGVCQNSTDASNDFLYWIDENCKSLNDIMPLKRK